MLEPFTLTTLLLAGAAAASTELAKEATKDAYRKLKEKVGELFGARASKAVAKVEDSSTYEEGRRDLERYVGDTLEPDETLQLEPFAQALVRALREDEAAREAVHSRIGFDIEAVGNVTITDIEGARSIDARIRSEKDVSIGRLRMDTGREPGK